MPWQPPLTVTDPVARTRECAMCHEVKPFEQFYFSRTRRGGGIYAYCKDCSRIVNKRTNEKRKEARKETLRRWLEEHKEQRKQWERKRLLLRKFKLSVDDYDALLMVQHGVCAICGNPPEEGKVLSVDHCHKTNVVRGLLCPKCNTAIGMLNDDVKRLRAAIKYLQTPPEWPRLFE